MFCSFSSVYVSVFTAYSLHADIACRYEALQEFSTVPQVCCPVQPLLSSYICNVLLNRSKGIDKTKLQKSIDDHQRKVDRLPRESQ